MKFDYNDLPDHVKKQVQEKTGKAPIEKKNTSHYAIGLTPKGEMNKTEAAFAKQLNLQKKAGEILDWKYETFRVRLAKDTSYEIDFMIMQADRTILCIDVKGRWTQATRVKAKMAAKLWPWFRWGAAKKSKTGGGFEYEYFN